MLQASLGRRLGEFALDVELTAEHRSTFVLVGESGSGKSSVLRLLAGLLRPDRGTIRVDGDAWCDSAAGIWRAAPERAVGHVAQDYALFPHLTVIENVAFGLRASGLGRRAAHGKAAALLERFELTALADRRPNQLSGGQQQRVALARALALEPRLLLLDEPLSALDVETRHTVRTELRRLLEGLPCITVFVTHAPMEALLFGDRIGVMERGKLVQAGDRMSLLKAPRSRYVATLLGLNLLPGTVQSRRGEEVTLETARGPVTAMTGDTGQQLFAVISPDQVTLSREAAAGSARNRISGTIAEILPEPPYGERVRVVIGPAPAFVAEITAGAAEELQLRVGQSIHASFKATSVTAYS
ncbi:MAG TPA: ABC transporter ATP-binding protein [Gemmatimonadales bacterium]|nr:ABC transporter ATP-binding protein [Gemmatimonadales bacterium]